MFDLTGEEREILENKLRSGSFLDRVRMFFGTEGEERDIEDLLWGEVDPEQATMRCDIEGDEAYYMIRIDDEYYVVSYDDGRMFGGVTLIGRTEDLVEAIEMVEDHYLEG